MNIKFQDWTCGITKAKYPNGRIALQLYDLEDGCPVAKATVNVPDAQLSEDETIIKSYSENTGMYESLLEAKVITPAIRSVAVGFERCNVVKVLI